MKLPEINNPQAYRGLYVIDFGEYCSVGFTAREVAEILESEMFSSVKVYRIYNARVDGQLELRGVSREIFELESGMFFYADDETVARDDFKRLCDMAVSSSPPERAKVHLASMGDRYVTAIIYPAEADYDFSGWLKAGGYRTNGFVEGGIGAVSQYYNTGADVLESRQLFGKSNIADRSGPELLADIRKPLQRFAS